MRIKLLTLVLVIAGLSISSVEQVHANESLEALARQAVSEDLRERSSAITALREMGPAGLRVLFEVHAGEIARHLSEASASDLRPASSEWQRIASALDAVSRQRDSYASGLYWYTDLEQAKAAARESGRPILSLRLLGKLDEEFSCANSRFFRTVLYANRDVSGFLRDRFILHWKSVRPAPRVTIDFGDGRRLERTLTGNSIHYILDSQGRPVDALPGLYGPALFLRGLREAEVTARRTVWRDAEQRKEMLRRFHDSRMKAIIADWASDVAKVGGTLPVGIMTETPGSSGGNPPSAVVAAAVAVTKSVVEVNTVRAITTSTPITYDPQALARATDEATWAKIAGLHTADARLDGTSITLMRRHRPYMETTAAGAAESSIAREQFPRLVQNFERYLALDTVRNEYLLHTRLYKWFADGAAGADVEALNERVYAELFLTPGSDPWLGLFSPGTYTALENDGVIKVK